MTRPSMRSWRSVRSTARSPPTLAATARIARPTQVSCDRGIGSHRPEAPALRIQKSRPAFSMRIRPGRMTRSKRSASATLSWRKKVLSETTVAAFFRQLYAVRQAVARQVPGAARITKPDTEKDTELPVHRGAAAVIDGTELRSLTGTVITSGSRCCFYPGLVRLAPGYVTI